MPTWVTISTAGLVPGYAGKASWALDVVNDLEYLKAAIESIEARSNLFGVFAGSGADGDRTDSASTTFATTTGKQLEDWQVDSAAVVDCSSSIGAVKVACSGRLTLTGANSRIHVNGRGTAGGAGGVGAGISGGAAGDQRWGLGQAIGGGGGSGATGAAGGGSGAGGASIVLAASAAGGAAVAGINSNGLPGAAGSGAYAFNLWWTSRGTIYLGHGGGGGGSSRNGGASDPGAAGGPGGGLFLAEVNELDFQAGTFISANASAGQNSAAGATGVSGGGGGGGGGGSVVLLAKTIITNAGTVQATGGAGGIGTGGAFNGGTGGTGGAGQTKIQEV